MSVLERFSRWSWVPRPFRHRLQEVLLRPLVSVQVEEAARATLICREQLPQCVTRHSRKQLAHCIADIEAKTEKMQASAKWRRLADGGRRQFAAASEALRVTLSIVKDICERDIWHQQEMSALTSDRDRLAREIAPLRVGLTDTEFRRYDSQFHQRSLAFERCRSLAEIKDCLMELRRAVAAIDRLLSKRKTIDERVSNASETLNSLDSRVLAGDPRAEETYRETIKILRTVRENASQADPDRTIALLNQVDQNLLNLRQEADHLRRYATAEVELWRRIAITCPRAVAPFSKQLMEFPAELTGDSLTQWAVVRHAMEKAIIAFAQQTRMANAEALADARLSYKWREDNDRDLGVFSQVSYQMWKERVSNP